jgi:hypothetical protein
VGIEKRPVKNEEKSRRDAGATRASFGDLRPLRLPGVSIRRGRPRFFSAVRNLYGSAFHGWTVIYGLLIWFVFLPPSVAQWGGYWGGLALSVLLGACISVIVGALDAWSKSKYGY